MFLLNEKNMCVREFVVSNCKSGRLRSDFQQHVNVQIIINLNLLVINMAKFNSLINPAHMNQ